MITVANPNYVIGGWNAIFPPSPHVVIDDISMMCTFNKNHQEVYLTDSEEDDYIIVAYNQQELQDFLNDNNINSQILSNHKITQIN